jgi:DNA-binding transcriptional LysR family regulator
MDFVQLRAFVMVAKEGNLTRAAEKLHVTQPAVSLQIKSLQEQLGLSLFKRTSNGMVLTKEGVQLHVLAERLLLKEQEFRQQAVLLQTSSKHVSGSLAIGTILDPEFIRLGVFLKRLVELHPRLSTQLAHHMSGTVLQHIKSGKLDVGFYLGAPGKGFHSITLTTYTYSVIAPTNWKNRIQGKNWSELAELPWIWTPPESIHHRLLSKIFAEHHVMPKTVALVDQESSMLDLVKSGIGLSLARKSIALSQSYTQGVSIADAVELSTELSFVCLEKRLNEPAIAEVLMLLTDIWENESRF